VIKSVVKKVMHLLNRLKTNILNNPYAFNIVRSIIAGDQHQTKLFIKQNLKKYKCKSVIDVCSGTGDFSSLITKDMSYLGVDINKSFIDYSTNKFRSDKNKSFINADILNPSLFKEKIFDAVILISTLHHFSDNELKIFLPLVKKITKKILIVADIIPNPPHLIQRLAVKLDQGKYIRTEKDKTKILNTFFKIIKTETISSRLAIQYGIICKV
jgi:SAM-dependent methyltransferase